MFGCLWTAWLFACVHYNSIHFSMYVFNEVCVHSCICLHKYLSCMCVKKCLRRLCELFRGIIASSVSRARSMAFRGVSMFYDMLWIIRLIYEPHTHTLTLQQIVRTLSHSVCTLLLLLLSLPPPHLFCCMYMLWVCVCVSECLFYGLWP